MFFLRRISVWLVIILASFFLRPHTAQADPHAMFYTATGQQQLFFNVLAALDQADYVEPAGNFDPEAGNNRAALLEKRTAAEFGAEDNDAINATKTNLASILTRSVTLEGNDLWTAFLVHQFAIENARRIASDELLRVFCERGLGRIGCTRKSAGVVASQVAEATLVRDPIQRASEIGKAGAAAVYSGTVADQEIREKLNDEDDKEVAKRPRPFDSHIAQQRVNAASSTTASGAAERVAAAVVSASGKVNPNAFSNLTENQNGQIKLADDNNSIDVFTLKLSSLINNPQNVLSTAIRGQQQVGQFQSVEEEAGSIADTSIKVAANQGGSTAGAFDQQGIIPNAQAQAVPGFQYKTVSGIIDTPATARIAMINSLATTLGSLNTNIAYADPNAVNEPGTQEAVERPRSSDQSGISSNSSNTNSVAGTSNQNTGEVAGILDYIFDNESGSYEYYGEYDKPRENLDPNTNLIAPHREQGAYDALLALTDDTYRNDDPNRDNPDCGFCVAVEQVLAEFLRYIAEFFCSIFPVLCGR